MSTRRRTYVWLFGCSRTGFGGKPYFEKTHTNTADDLSLRIYTHTYTHTVYNGVVAADIHRYTHMHTRSSIRLGYRRHPSRPSLEVGAPIPRAAARVWSPGGRPVFISSVVVVVAVVLYIYIYILYISYIIYYSSILQCVIYLYIY